MDQEGRHAVYVRLDPATYQALLAAALDQDRSVSAVVRRAVLKDLNGGKKSEPWGVEDD